MLKRQAVSLFVAVLIPWVAACGAGGGEEGQSTLSTTDPNQGACAPAVAAKTCGTDVSDANPCYYTPTAIDCKAACEKIAALCEAGCLHCDRVQSDPAQCQADCAAHSGQRCANVTYGCYAESPACSEVDTCILAAL